ncbi:MAG: type III pantothenate kinase [Thermodesulfovibrionales bacterium]
MLLLAIDIGNSSINIGFFSGSDILGRLKIPARPVMAIEEYRSEIDVLLSKKAIEKPLNGVIISSVVPEVTGILKGSVRELSLREPMILNTSLNTGLSFDVDRPDEIGSDRIADVVAAREKFGDPVVVIDFGTATTISACKNGKFLGGSILPGLGLMADALHRKTSRLPQVDIGSELVGQRDIPAIGRDTNKCIISGIIYGTAGAVERLTAEMEMEKECDFRVVITGGYSGLIARLLKRDFYLEPDLTLNGLRLIYERNA